MSYPPNKSIDHVTLEGLTVAQVLNFLILTDNTAHHLIQNYIWTSGSSHHLQVLCCTEIQM